MGKLHHRQEEVGEQSQRLIDLVHEQDFFLGVIPEIPDRPADDAPVLLLHEAVVVLPVRTGPCQGNVLLMAVTDQVVVHELAPVVRRMLRAYERLRCVRSMNPFRILDFSFFDAWRYCPCGLFMMACRCFMGVPICSPLICSLSPIVPPQSLVLEYIYS